MFVKVLFMNEIYQAFIATNTSFTWKHFTDILKSDSRMGESHLEVPGPDGKFGFGGACFPKDISALISFVEEDGGSLDLIKSVKKINNKIRSNYKDLDQREKDQNVNFDN